jgi:hypothetical protein
LPNPQKIYSITKRVKTLDEGEKYFLGFLPFIDSTEQQIPRPKNIQIRKTYYSDNKKMHTALKTQLMVNNHVGLSFIKQIMRQEEEA